MSWSALPTEICLEILRYITSKRDLYALSITSRALQANAEFYIYQSIESSRRSLTESLCHIIILSPRFHGLVRSLSIYDEDNLDPAPPEYWELIAQLLEKLSQLETLKIYDGVGERKSWVLNHCISSLRKIDCHFSLDDSESIAAFFRRQHNLKEISWTSSNTEPSLDTMNKYLPPHSPCLIPSVRVLTTNCPQFALRVMDSRSLTHVYISGPCADNQEGWVQYITTFGRDAEHLRSLRMNMPFERRILLVVMDNLAKYAIRLRSLGFIPYFDAKDNDLITILAQFKRLESLVTWNVISANTLKKLAEYCPSLRLVACLHYSYSHEYVVLPVNPLGTPRAVHDPEYRLWRDA